MAVVGNRCTHTVTQAPSPAKAFPLEKLQERNISFIVKHCMCSVFNMKDNVSVSSWEKMKSALRKAALRAKKEEKGNSTAAER